MSSGYNLLFFIAITVILLLNISLNVRIALVSYYLLQVGPISQIWMDLNFNQRNNVVIENFFANLLRICSSLFTKFSWFFLFPKNLNLNSFKFNQWNNVIFEKKNLY
jgi:hypothetical protein